MNCAEPECAFSLGVSHPALRIILMAGIQIAEECISPRRERWRPLLRVSTSAHAHTAGAHPGGSIYDKNVPIADALYDDHVRTLKKEGLL